MMDDDDSTLLLEEVANLVKKTASANASLEQFKGEFAAILERAKGTTEPEHVANLACDVLQTQHFLSHNQRSSLNPNLYISAVINDPVFHALKECLPVTVDAWATMLPHVLQNLLSAETSDRIEDTPRHGELIQKLLDSVPEASRQVTFAALMEAYVSGNGPPMSHRQLREFILSLNLPEGWETPVTAFLYPALQPLREKYPGHDVSVIDRGGIGTVFRVAGGSQQTTFAVKVANPDPVLGDAFRKYLKKELEALRRLDRSLVVSRSTTLVAPKPGNAIEIIDKQISGFELEFVGGDTLQSYIDSSETATWPLSYVMQVLAEISVRMAYVNQTGIIHRDLKPANIIIETPVTSWRPRDRVRLRIIDFNLSTDGENLHNRVCSGCKRSRIYASPEQSYDPGRLDPGGRSDVFSWAMIAYRLIKHDFAYDPELYESECKKVQSGKTREERNFAYYGFIGQKLPDDLRDHVRELPQTISDVLRNSANLNEAERKHRFVDICRLLATYWVRAWGTATWRRDVESLLDRQNNPLLNAQLKGMVDPPVHPTSGDEDNDRICLKALLDDGHEFSLEDVLTARKALDGIARGKSKSERMYSNHSVAELIEIANNFSESCERELSEFLSGQRSSREVYDELADSLRNMLEADTVSLMRWDQPTRRLTIAASKGFSTKHRDGKDRVHRYPVLMSDPLAGAGIGITGHVVLTGGVQLFENRSQIESHFAWSGKSDATRDRIDVANTSTESQMVARIGGREQLCCGVAKVESNQPRKYGVEAALLFSIVSNYLQSVFRKLPEPFRALLLLNDCGDLSDRVANECTNAVSKAGGFCISTDELKNSQMHWRDELQRADIVIAYYAPFSDQLALAREVNPKLILICVGETPLNDLRGNCRKIVSFDPFRDKENRELFEAVFRAIRDCLSK